MSLVDSIIGAESGGDPNARNPNSSASGPGQFIDSTFLDVARKMRPELADRPDSEVLGLKTDPEFARQATDYYAQQNQAVLAKNGLPVTPGSSYLAHFAGPGGAVKILQADPNASVADILGPKVVAANPFLKDMTAQGLQAWAAKKMGASVPEPGVQMAQSGSPSEPPPTVRPQDYMTNGNIRTYPGDVLQSMSGNAHYNSKQEQRAAPPQQPAPIFPPQTPPQAVPPPMQAPDIQGAPIFYAPRKPIDLSALRNAFQAPVFPRG